MAEKLKIPNQVIDSDWKDDVDVDYAIYGSESKERSYVSPEEVSRDSIKRIKARKTGRAALGFFNKNQKLAA